MIADYHQRTLRQPNVDAARRIRQDERLDAQQLESADWKSDFFERVAFVVMHSPLHRQHRHTLDFANHQTSRMTFRGGTYKSRYLFVRNTDSFIEVVSKTAEPAAEHERNSRLHFCPRPNYSRSMFSSFVKTRACHSLNHNHSYFSF